MICLMYCTSLRLCTINNVYWYFVLLIILEFSFPRLHYVENREEYVKHFYR